MLEQINERTFVLSYELTSSNSFFFISSISFNMFFSSSISDFLIDSSIFFKLFFFFSILEMR